MKKIYTKYKKLFTLLFILVGIVLIYAIWDISSLIYNEFNVFPTFEMSFVRFLEILTLGSTYKAIGITLGVSSLSIIVSLLLAFFFAIISYYFEFIRNILKPFVTFFKVVPTICIVIILILFMKNIVSNIIIVFLIIFPIMYESCLNGFLNIDQNIIKSLRIEGFYRTNSLFRVIIPEASPYIIVGIIQSIGLGLKVEIMAEILMSYGSLYGLGYLIYTASNVTFEFIDIYSYIILIVILYGFIDVLLHFILKKLKLNIKTSFLW